jgi:hypothetical protein
VLLPPLLAGGGPAQPAQPHAPARPVVADPAVVALAVLLSDSPEATPPSTLRQLTGQLASLLAVTTERVRGLLPSFGRDEGPAVRADAGTQPAAPRVDVVPATPMQSPPPPLGPTLTLDPALGTIVVDESGAAGDATGTPERGHDDATTNRLPSLWPGLAGYRFGPALRGVGTLADRIAALLRERGITRLQLLALTIAAPIIVTVAIAIVDAILGGR